MSEQSDALVLVISEETGAISIARNGHLTRNITDGEAREKLLEFLKIPVGGDKRGK
jgi:diadenylate cyclase